MTVTSDDVESLPPSTPRWRPGPWLRRLMIAAPVLLLAGFALVATAVPAIQVRQLSILDEAAHIDSVFKVPSIDRSGEKFLPQTLAEISCRGGIQQWPDWVPPPCGIPQGVPSDNYQVGSGGYNTADIHPPVYYFVTAALAGVAGWFIDSDPVTLMRLTGGLYLAIGVCLTWWLARRLGANRWSAFGVAGLVATAPDVRYMSSIVNVDASVIMASAAFWLAALTVWRRRSAWWILPLLAIGLMLVKMTNLGALIVTALFLIFTELTAPIPPGDPVPETARSLARRAPGPDGPAATIARWRVDLRHWASHNGQRTARAVGLSGLMACGAVLVTVGWTRIQSFRALVPADQLWFTQQFKVDRLLIGNIGDSLLRFWEPRGLWAEWLSGRPYLGSVLLMLTAAVPLGLVVRAWCRLRPAYPILLAALVTMAIAAPVYVVMNYVVNGIYFNPDFRYGLSVLPFFAAAVGAGIRTRVAGGVVAGLAVVGMATTLVSLT